MFGPFWVLSGLLLRGFVLRFRLVGCQDVSGIVLLGFGALAIDTLANEADAIVALSGGINIVELIVGNGVLASLCQRRILDRKSWHSVHFSVEFVLHVAEL